MRLFSQSFTDFDLIAALGVDLYVSAVDVGGRVFDGVLVERVDAGAHRPRALLLQSLVATRHQARLHVRICSGTT